MTFAPKLRRATDKNLTNAVSVVAAMQKELIDLRQENQDHRASAWAIRELLGLDQVSDKSLYEQVAENEEYREVGKVRLQNALHNVLVEPLGISSTGSPVATPQFLMRLTMLAHEAGLRGYLAGNPRVAAAVETLGDPGQANLNEDVRAAIYRPECRPDGPDPTSGVDG